MNLPAIRNISWPQWQFWVLSGPFWLALIVFFCVIYNSKKRKQTPQSNTTQQLQNLPHGTNATTATSETPPPPSVSNTRCLVPLSIVPPPASALAIPVASVTPSTSSIAGSTITSENLSQTLLRHDELGNGDLESQTKREKVLGVWDRAVKKVIEGKKKEKEKGS